MNIITEIEQGNIKLHQVDNSFIVLNTETKNIMRSPNLVHYKVRHLKPVAILLLAPSDTVHIDDMIITPYGKISQVRTKKCANIAKDLDSIVISHSSRTLNTDANFKYLTSSQIDEIIIELNKRPELCTL